MHFNQEFLEQGITEVMDRSGQQYLIEIVTRKRLCAEIGADEVHVGVRAIHSGRLLDRTGIQIHAVVLILKKGIRNVAVSAAEIEQLS